MMQYTVRSGDTLWTIAEQSYGDGQLWSYLADHNPLARFGVLYEGQSLEVPPPPPGRLRSLADARRLALPLGHVPVKLTLDGGGPLFRYDGLGVAGISGLVGELTFHRHGPVHLGELTASRLLGYRLEQLAWAKSLFVERFCNPNDAKDACYGFSTERHVAPNPFHSSGPGYTITGQIGNWRMFNVVKELLTQYADGRLICRASLALDPMELFNTATLLLGEQSALTDAQREQLVPLGRVLRAACPDLISPAALWMLTRDNSFIPQSQTLSPATPVSDWSGTQATSASSVTEPQPPARKNARRPAQKRSFSKKRTSKPTKSRGLNSSDS